MHARTRRGRSPHGRIVVGAIVGFALAALTGLPAAADRDPQDSGGRLDIRAVNARRDASSGSLTVRVRTWGSWNERLLREAGPNRLVVLFDVDVDGDADARARVLRAAGELVARVHSGGGPATTLPVERPGPASVRFVVPAGSEANPAGDVGGIAARTRAAIGAACSPVCGDRSPDHGFDVVGTEPPPPGGTFVCTEVVGFSQTAQWSLGAPDFQDVVGDAAWQVRWVPGGEIRLWANAGFRGWNGDAESPCDAKAGAPDRIVLTITSQDFEPDASVFVPWIVDAVGAATTRYPSVEQVVLQPVVGGPGNGSCLLDGDQVRATHNHPLIDAAIAQVTDGAVIAGPSPEVRTCDDYSDGVGHLLEAARGPIGRTIGDAYV